MEDMRLDQQVRDDLKRINQVHLKEIKQERDKKGGPVQNSIEGPPTIRRSQIVDK